MSLVVGAKNLLSASVQICRKYPVMLKIRFP